MMRERSEYDRLASTLGRFAVAYNKSIVQTAITDHTYDIIGQKVEDVRGGLENVVAAFEEIRATTESTSSSSVRLNGMMKEVLEKNGSIGEGIGERVVEIDEAVSGARNLDQLFRRLEEKSKEIEERTGDISDLSERTNVLAINASIEAARAGEVGRGFRIIANEVRNLANRSGGFARDVSDSIGEFNGVIREISGSMDQFVGLIEKFREDLRMFRERFDDNGRVMHRAGDSLSHVSESVQEQNVAMNDGLASLERISSLLDETGTVFSSLKRAHSYLDRLLDEKS